MARREEICRHLLADGIDKNKDLPVAPGAGIPQERFARYGISLAYDALVGLGPLAVPALIEALGDTHRHLAGSVILIIGAIRARESVDPLIRLMESDRDLAVYAIWALGEIGDARASTPLVKRLSDSSDIIVRASEEALKKIG